MGVNDLTPLGRSSLHLGDLILEEAVQATYAKATFSLVELVVKRTDVPEIIAIIKNTNSRQRRLSLFWSQW